MIDTAFNASSLLFSIVLDHCSNLSIGLLHITFISLTALHNLCLGTSLAFKKKVSEDHTDFLILHIQMSLRAATGAAFYYFKAG